MKKLLIKTTALLALGLALTLALTAKATAGTGTIIKEEFSCSIAYREYAELTRLLISTTFVDVSKYQLLRERGWIATEIDRNCTKERGGK